MYDNTSFYGDIICDEYDDKNNLMIPESPVGKFIYQAIGGGFDSMSDMCATFLNDFSILSCDASSLDTYWGVSYNLPRPRLPDSQRLLTDEEYRIYLYLKNCQLITRENIEVNFNKCFQIDENKIFFTTETHYVTTVDHNSYISEESERSNLSRNDNDDSKNYITNHSSDDGTELLEGLMSVVEEVETIINIPSNGWDSEFLSFLEGFISIKGNLRIKESLI